MNKLSLALLRDVNMARLPLFKNKLGQPAHTTIDGHDWSPAQWFQATLGEFGELAQVRTLYEAGMLTELQYRDAAAKEAADVQTYFAIMCVRMYDQLTRYKKDDGLGERQGYPFSDSVAQILMELVGNLGSFANNRKKYDRGDYTLQKYEELAHEDLTRTWYCFDKLRKEAFVHTERKHPGDVVEVADPVGIDLGQACVDKFNEVSARVGADVKLSEDGREGYLDGAPL
jgi:hypothetical protein